MKIYEQGLSPELCTELMNFGKSYLVGDESISTDGYPNPVMTRTNYSWGYDFLTDSKPVLIYYASQRLKELVKQELVDLGILVGYESVRPMVYVWTPGSYIPIHEDGHVEDHNRMVLTAYLNNEWDISWGGTYHYKDISTGEWKILIPKQGLLVFNSENETHYTVPVLKDAIRYSLQIFIDRSQVEL